MHVRLATAGFCPHWDGRSHTASDLKGQWVLVPVDLFAFEDKLIRLGRGN